MNSITNKDKKEFLEWFLKEHTLKRRECVWLLIAVKGDEELLNNISFVDEVYHCPRGMMISTMKFENVPFRFYEDNSKIADAEKVFDSIRTKKDEKLYIQLNFPNKHKCVRYAGVHEENEFIPELLRVDLANVRIADNLINSQLEELKMKKLKMEIDKALDTKNEKEFMRLSKELNEFERSF